MHPVAADRWSARAWRPAWCAGTSRLPLRS